MWAKKQFYIQNTQFFKIIREKDLAKRPCLIIAWKEPFPLPKPKKKKSIVVFAYNKI